jgi:YidC/Oxa1 family membrane protein insertase
MRLIMVPLFIKQMHTTRAMSSLQPQMAALRKKYKNDKQTLNQETMKLYQEAGVNPLMGCLPMVLQLPLFFSLFSVLRAIADWKPGQVPAYHLPLHMVQAAQSAEIFGAHLYDKVLFTSSIPQGVPFHSKVVIFVAVLISMATTFLTIRQSQKRGMMPAATPDNPMASSQKYMTYIMPFFALTGLYWPFGLVLYWVTTNVWTLGQQFILGQRYPYTPPAPADGAAVASTAGARSLTAGGTKGSGSKGTSVKGTPVKRALPTGQAQSGGGARPSRATANGAGANGKGGPGAATPGSVLKRLSNRRTEPEAEPELPDVKLVRHQTQRQSRSKRSGKR